MTNLQERLVPAAPSDVFAAAEKAYDRNTYGEVAAEHGEGINAVVEAVWPRGYQAGFAEGRASFAAWLRDKAAGWQKRAEHESAYKRTPAYQRLMAGAIALRGAADEIDPPKGDET